MKYKIIVDRQPKTNPTDEKREYEIDIEELRVKGDVYDSLVITKDEAHVVRRLNLSECHVLSILENEVIEPLNDLDITLFEGDNYIYLMDMTGNKFYAEYLVNNDFNDIYATRNEMNSAISQTAKRIELSVNQKLEGYSNTQEMNSAIELKANSITNSVSETYTTKTETNTAKTDAINSANASTDNKLQNYSTTTQMNSAITQKANEITSSVSSTYATKDALNTAKSEIKQTTDSIESTVSNKIGNNEIVAKLNLAIKNGQGVAEYKGNTIIIEADNCTIDENGNFTCSNANITGGNIVLTAPDANTPRLIIKGDDNNYMWLGMSIFRIVANGQGSVVLSPSASAFASLNGDQTVIAGGYVSVKDSSGTDQITLNGSNGEVRCVTLQQTSLKKDKKNFQKLENAIDILKKIDIYKYNFKNEDNNAKKHIGFVIGEIFKYREEVTSAKNDGVDIYSFVSLCCKAIQEQQEKIENLEKRLEVLENE